MKKELTENQIENLLQTWQVLEKQQKQIAEQVKAIKDTLQTHADETGMGNGDYFLGVTLKSRYDDLWKDKFNANKLKADNIDLYNKYLQCGYTHQVTINKPQLF